MTGKIEQLTIPPRTLMGPGPTDVDPKVLAAMSMPLLSHLDPHFLKIMNELLDMTRQVFKTSNTFAAPVPGTGHAGMEACLINALEPGDTAVVGVCGLFGQRMADIVGRTGADLIVVENAWGQPLDPLAVNEAMNKAKKPKLLAVVHGETSTGVLQPLGSLSKIAKEHDALFLVDTVVTLGGCEVRVDDWGIDIAYSGSQKCLSAPPGLAPVTLNDRAVEVLKNRKRKVQSWYLDLTMLLQYWGKERFYHHTAPINMIYAMHEAMRLLLEEGLDNAFARHARHGRALSAGLEAMNIELPVDPEYRIPHLVVARIPEGLEDAKVRRMLVENYGIEIGGGLGPSKGQIWRIGLLGYSAREKNVLALLAALEDIFRVQGYRGFDPGAGLAAARAVYEGK
ncbi:MAG: alanine--glyoxylate aminotransferase family protein [Bacillota bacterium]